MKIQSLLYQGSIYFFFQTFARLESSVNAGLILSQVMNKTVSIL